MGYLSNFQEDVFISYAHIDDQTHLDEEKGWVAYLEAELQKQVAELLGAKDLSVWRDPDIRENEYFEQKILTRLTKAATLISIMSPSFFRSEWCLRELEKFAENAENTSGIQVDDEKSRIFKVEKLPVDRHILPEALQRIGSYKFYKSNPDRPGHVSEFRPQLGKRDKEDYWQRCNDLAQDIVAVLVKMNEQAKGLPAPGIDRPTVFLGVTTEDVEDKANEMRRDLKSRGYHVLPAGNLPIRLRDLKTELRNSLSKSVISIHLVGEAYGLIPEGEAEKSVAWLQNEMAIERAHESAFMRLIWMPPDLRPTDPRQQKFVDYLRNDSAAQEGADVLESKIEDLKTAVQESLREIEDRRKASKLAMVSAKATVDASRGTSAAPTPTSQEPQRIYIICDQVDLTSEGLVTLRKYLFSQNLQYILPSEIDDEGEALREHTENMELCDACLIYYGQGSPKWLNAKLRDFRKLLSQRAQPILAKAIYIALPETPEKKEFETLEALVINGLGGFDKNALTPFLDRLKPAQTGWQK